jgi:phage-related minor tail protein
MDDKDVFCVSCGEAIVINLDMIDQIIECPACHTRLRLDEAQDDDSGENDIEWSPDVDASDATRVFGVVGQPAPAATLGTDQAGNFTKEAATPAVAMAPARSPLTVIQLFTFAVISGLGWLFYQETERTARLEERLEFVEQKLIPLKRSLAGSTDALSKISDLQDYLDELDETVSQIASVLRLQNATSLQTEYGIQSTQKNLFRQETELGRITMKLALVEQSVADKSRHAKEAFELSVQQRKEAEMASKPIRQRIRELEDQENTLFAQYRAGSIAKYPQGVVSKGRATKIMKDYERKAAPLLEQIQQEIARVREAIEIEEAKIESLYRF